MSRSRSEINRTMRYPHFIGSDIPFEEALRLVGQRIKNKITVDANGCWLWPYKNPSTGYVQLNVQGKRFSLHRLSYESFKGPITPGLSVLHTCDVRHCCNPEHLWLGTISDNKQDELRKGRNYEANRTHCPRGHSYAEHGVRIGAEQNRQCRICMRARSRKQDGWPEHLAYEVPKLKLKGRVKKLAFLTPDQS